LKRKQLGVAACNSGDAAIVAAMNNMAQMSLALVLLLTAGMCVAMRSNHLGGRLLMGERGHRTAVQAHIKQPACLHLNLKFAARLLARQRAQTWRVQYCC
jgi:hypothetical protein